MLKNRRRQNGNWNLWEKKRNKFKELRKVTVNEGKMSPETDYSLLRTEPDMPTPVCHPE